MNRRDKVEAAKRLAEQYLRSEKLNFNNGLDEPEYNQAWRDACRSCAVSLGVYDEFVRLTEKAPVS